jgi:hypothetical protein
MPEAIRVAQSQRLAKGGGTLSISQYAGGMQPTTIICGLGLLLLGIRDGWRAWKKRRECGTPSAENAVPE